MMDAAYPVSAHVCVVRCSKLTGHIQDKTWVDFLNHFNMSSYTQRVVESMGNLYATKSCRALYFENSSSRFFHPFFPYGPASLCQVLTQKI